jgi:gamma-glutamyltranspeptidase/glutathione hydrolase
VLSDAGSSALYDGELSDALCSGLAARGVPITREDLRDFEVEESSPLVAEVAGWRVQSGRPNSQAYMVPRLLAMLAAVESADAERLLHRRVTAHRLAFAFYLATLERDDVLGDPTAMTQDVGELLTPDAARSFAQRVVNSSLSDIGAGASTPRPTGDTVAVVAADDEGRSVSLIQSLFHGFGSLILEPTTGILMHDRGACFSLDPASPNALAPGKRPLHTLSPVLAESIANDGDRLVVGTMGGHAQPQILTQVLSHLIAGQSAQQSVSLPRMTVGAWDDDESADTLAWEQDLDPEMARELGQYPGTTTRVTQHHSRMGHAHAIAVTASGMDVGTDPRADG